MNIQQLKYFIEVAQTKNLSSAARSLFVTQPTLSISIKKLESELNTTLFDHRVEPFRLTPSGTLLYKKGTLVVEMFDELVDEMYELNQSSKNQKIRVGLTTIFSVQFMKEISLFLQTHPHIDVSLVQDGSTALQQKLKNHEIDICLTSFPNLFPKFINIEPLETTTKGYRIYVVVPNENPLSKETSLTFKQLENQRFSTLTVDKYVIGRLLLGRTRYYGYEPNIVLQNDDLQVLVSGLEKSNSICLLPIEYKGIGKSDGVKWIPLEDKYSHFSIGIGLRKDFILSPDMEEFIECIKRN